MANGAPHNRSKLPCLPFAKRCAGPTTDIIPWHAVCSLALSEGDFYRLAAFPARLARSKNVYFY